MTKDYLDMEKYTKRGDYHWQKFNNNHYSKIDTLTIFDYLCKLEPQKNKSIIEIGCGDGLWLGLLRDAGYTNIFGIDANEVAVELAKKHNLPVKYQQAHELDIQFDICLMFDAFEHFTNPEEVVKTLNKTIKSRIHILNPDWDEDKYHYKRYRIDDFIKLFGMNWELVSTNMFPVSSSATRVKTFLTLERKFEIY